MAGDGKSLKFELVVGADGLVEGLKVATKGVDGAAQEVKTSLNAMGAAAHESAEPLSNFTEYIRDFAKEERQQQRLGGFLAKQIDEIGFAGKGAAGGVTQLVSAFAFGGGLGAATEAVKMLVTVFFEAGEAAEKQAEAVKKSVKEITQSVNEAMEKVRESFGPKKTLTQSAWEAEAKKVKEANAKIQEQIDAIVAKSGGWRDLLHDITTDASGKDDAMTVKGTAQLVAPLIAQQQANIAALERMKPKRDEVAGEEAKHDAGEKAKKDEKTEEQHNATLLGLQAQLLDGEDKLRLEFEATKQQIRNNEQLSEQQKNDQILTGEMVLDQKIAKLKEDRRKKEEADEKAFIDAVTANSIADRKKVDDYNERSFEAMDKVRKHLANEDKKRLTDAIADAQRLGSAFGEAFAGMIDGSKSFGDAMKEVGKEVVRTLLDIAIKSVTAHALEAGSGAAASQAGIPIVGPALAAAAMTAMVGTVMGLMSSMPSASGGFDIPAGLNPVTQLHEKEMVLPAHIAEPLRQNLAGGGGLGGDVHMHVTAMDAGSFREWLSRPSTQTELVRSLAEMRKRGRI